ncbi:MAG: hypothetical protein J2O48_07810 [Solirubrobacterales bacterium]|nr:hypothetical protein [Solirubrobacterales bacterium]
MEAGDLDLAGAELRSDARDIPAFVAALATRLEDTVPTLVQVQRKRAGLLGGPKVVRRIQLAVGDWQYTLDCDGANTDCRRAKIVRQIAVKNETLELSDWVRSLSDALVSAAAIAADGRQTLENLLLY